jgi:cytochrome P450
MLSYPPTPPTRHWLFGHAHAVDLTKTTNHDILFLHWMHDLKSKVVMFELPIVGRFIVVGDAAVARYVLSGNFRKSPTYRALLPLIGKKSLVTMEGGEWSAQRRIYNPGFSPDFLRGIVSTIVEKCDRLVAKCDEDIGNGASTNMLAKAIDLTIDVIVSVAFGEDWFETEDDVHKVNTIRELTKLTGERMKEPLKQYLSFGHMWRTWRLSKALDRDMKCLVQRRLEKLCELDTASVASEMSKQKDILSLTLLRVLQSNKAAPGELDSRKTFGPDDMEIITSQLKTFYFAGHDTTATTIAWAYWLLVQHPESLRRARDEVESSIGPHLRDATYEKLQKCEYLDAVARETLRLYPPAATTRYVSMSSDGPAASSAKRAISSDSSSSNEPNAGGYRLGDSIVHLNFYAIQRDPDVWEKPDEFVPDRFLGEAGKNRIASSSFLPFSKGSRDCIGKYFALLEIKIALAVLVCRYDGDVVDTEEAYVAKLTSIPQGGCKVNLRRRSVA